jgi:membrane protein involved in colicin uptake
MSDVPVRPKRPSDFAQEQLDGLRVGNRRRGAFAQPDVEDAFARVIDVVKRLEERTQRLEQEARDAPDVETARWRDAQSRADLQTTLDEMRTAAEAQAKAVVADARRRAEQHMAGARVDAERLRIEATSAVEKAEAQAKEIVDGVAPAPPAVIGHDVADALAEGRWLRSLVAFAGQRAPMVLDRLRSARAEIDAAESVLAEVPAGEPVST